MRSTPVRKVGPCTGSAAWFESPAFCPAAAADADEPWGDPLAADSDLPF